MNDPRSPAISATLPYANANVLVLGASGFIGRWVARALVQRGCFPTLVVRNRSTAESMLSAYAIDGALLEADLGEGDALRRIIRSVHPSVTFNLVGYGVDHGERDPELAHEINAQLPARLGRLLSEHEDPRWPGPTLVHAGSAFEYGAATSQEEEAEARPTTDYGRSKLEGTESLLDLHRRCGLRAATARLFTVYGPGEHSGRLLPSLLEVARTGEPLSLTGGEQERDFTYVEDVACGLLRLAVAPRAAGKVINLATGRLTSVRRFVETAARLLRIRDEKLLFGARPTGPDETECDPARLVRLRTLTGWVPATGIESGVRRTVAFLRQQAMAKGGEG